MLIARTDGHNDLAILIRAVYNNRIYDERFARPFTEGGLAGHVDIPRLRAGMSGGAFWSVFWPCPENGSDYSDENYAPSECHHQPSCSCHDKPFFTDDLF